MPAPDPAPERRLAALLAADIVGFSRLTEADEAGTLARQRLHMGEVIRPTLAAQGGRIVKTTGDGLIAEFPSVVAAVRAAVAVQREMPAREAAAAEDRRIAYRVSVHLGDVEVDGDDLLGDAVNVAARLEALAPPNGLVLSGAAYDHLGSNAPARFVDEGERTLRNLSRRVRLWRWDEVAASDLTRAAPAPGAGSMVAVLPFRSLGSPDQDWFADGMIEDVIAALAHQPHLGVIARSSSFSYKGGEVNVAQVARELGADYVLEGSVRRAGARLRVTAQLIEAASGVHIWAERYDRQVEDVFDVQDELTEAVVGAVVDPIRRRRFDLSRRREDRDLTLQDLRWRVSAAGVRCTPEGFDEARALARRGFETAPEDALLHVSMTYVEMLSVLHGWSADPAASVARTNHHAARAIAADADAVYSHLAMSCAALLARDWERLRTSADMACRLAPNLADAQFFRGNAYMRGGFGLETALQAFDLCVRLSPRDVGSVYHQNNRAGALFLLGRLEEAAESYRHALALHPDFAWARFNLAACLALLGRREAAAAALSHALELVPAPDRAYFENGWRFARPADFERFLEGFRAAGLDGI